MNPQIIFDVLEVPCTDLLLRFNHFQVFTGSMGNSIFSVNVYFCLQMEWHVVYKYKEQNWSQYGSLRYTAFDWLAAWHFQPIHYTLKFVWKVWFKPAKRCAAYAIESQFLQKYFMINDIKSFLEVEEYCSNNVSLIYMLSQSFINLINSILQAWLSFV